MKKRILSQALACMMIVAIGTSSTALAAKKPSVESSQTPEVKRSASIPNLSPATSQSLAPQSLMLTPLLQTATVQQVASAPSLGPNLIKNNSVESSGSTNLPTNWNKGGYGTNNRSFTYPVNGYNSTEAVKVSIGTYTSGDAKWYFDDVPVTPGTTYEFSDYYISDVQSIIDARYTMNDGSFTYPELVSVVDPSSSYQKVSVQFTVPQNVKSMTVFHLINKVGSLTTDEYSLNQVTAVTPPIQPGNLVPNPAFEQPGSNGLPLSWGKGGWGTNSRTFTYPAVGASGNAVKVNISSYTSGDAKWYFNPVAVTQGDYTYSDDYTSNIPSLITVQYQNSDGTVTYKDIQTLPAASSFTHESVNFSVPAGVQAVSVFHLIEGVGSLTMDNVSLSSSPQQNQGIFSTGAVTLRFDDGWLSQYQVALPKLKSAGLKGTFFIISQQIADNGYAGFMSKAQIQSLYAAGNEIGAHTRTHPYLSQLSSADQQNEIQGSKNDLLAMNVGPSTSFAYPFGDYNDTTLSLVKSDGFSDAAATLDGDVTLSSDKYQLERQSMESNVTLAQTKQWIDNAIANKEWLILSFHQIDTSGVQYSISPTIFNQVVDYLKSKNIPVVTIQDGVKSLP